MKKEIEKDTIEDMAVPKKRHSTYRKGKRRAAKKLTLSMLSKCSNCNQSAEPHTVCNNCGYYKGRQVLKLKSKKDKRKEKKEGKKENKKKQTVKSANT